MTAKRGTTGPAAAGACLTICYLAIAGLALPAASATSAVVAFRQRSAAQGSGPGAVRRKLLGVVEGAVAAGSPSPFQSGLDAVMQTAGEHAFAAKAKPHARPHARPRPHPRPHPQPHARPHPRPHARPHPRPHRPPTPRPRPAGSAVSDPPPRKQPTRAPHMKPAAAPLKRPAPGSKAHPTPHPTPHPDATRPRGESPARPPPPATGTGKPASVLYSPSPDGGGCQSAINYVWGPPNEVCPAYGNTCPCYPNQCGGPCATKPPSLGACALSENVTFQSINLCANGSITFTYQHDRQAIAQSVAGPCGPQNGPLVGAEACGDECTLSTLPGAVPVAYKVTYMPPAEPSQFWLYDPGTATDGTSLCSAHNLFVLVNIIATSS